MAWANIAIFRAAKFSDWGSFRLPQSERQTTLQSAPSLLSFSIISFYETPTSSQLLKWDFLSILTTGYLFQ